MRKNQQGITTITPTITTAITCENSEEKIKTQRNSRKKKYTQEGSWWVRQAEHGDRKHTTRTPTLMILRRRPQPRHNASVPTMATAAIPHEPSKIQVVFGGSPIQVVFSRKP